MLATLRIKNIVLIQDLKIDFQAGLSALTGETGAGKSILLDSLGLALGARADSGLVRKGEEQGSVTAVFDLDNAHPVFDILKENDLDSDDDLILRRSITADGKSKAYVNDQAISAGLLKSVGALLVEIHGQFDTQSLLNPKTHMSLLDAYGQHGALNEKTSGAWSAWRQLEKKLQQEREAMEKARADEAYLRESLEDLDALSPENGEEEKLTQMRDNLKRHSQIVENLQEAESGLQAMETTSGSVFRAVEKIGEGAKTLADTLDRLNAEMQEALSDVQTISYDLENSEYSLEEIEDRLYALKNQAQKHGCSIDDLSAKREEIATALNAIEHQDGHLADLMKQVEKEKSSYVDFAQKLSEARNKSALKMQKLVMGELPPLKLEKASFGVECEIQEESEWNRDGMDQIQFLIATNPGSAAGPLNKIASGGEMARFMLALKVVLAEVGSAQTLVFDELDSGVGGATAAAIGDRLARLAEKRQILAVTHSPQVAATAGYHWIVQKSGDATTTTKIMALERNDRQEEIARMLAGAEITEEARAAAGKLLEAA